mgnify:CR=1 FL=1
MIYRKNQKANCKSDGKACNPAKVNLGKDSSGDSIQIENLKMQWRKTK